MPDDFQILKCRDDKAPIYLFDSEVEDAEERHFELGEGSICSWLHKDATATSSELRKRIEPWLTTLFQSEHLNVLIGSGLTHAIHYMAAEEGLPGMQAMELPIYDDEVAAWAKQTAELAGRKEGNIEDQLRAANELLRGLEILAHDNEDYEDEADQLRQGIIGVMDEFASSILAGENGIITADSEKLEESLNYLVSFLMSFASRTGTRDRLQIFTTNYDRVIELGAEVAGLHLLDRFVGSLAPVFRSSRLDIDMHYNPPGIRGEPRYLEGVARFTKLHGSVDWINSERHIRRMTVPLGADEISPYLNSPGLHGADSMQLMIYPNSAKDRETAAYPYVELFRDLASAICRPNSTLVTFGYSFGDEHINRVIEDMLTIPSTHLVVIAYSDPLEKIMEMYKRVGRAAQITLLIGNHFGDLRTLVDNYLPKPAIDRTTFRMADLLRARWGVDSVDTTVEDEPASETEEGEE